MILLDIIDIVLLHKISNVNLNILINLSIEIAVRITLLFHKNTAGTIYRAGATTHGATRNILKIFSIF